MDRVPDDQVGLHVAKPLLHDAEAQVRHLSRPRILAHAKHYAGRYARLDVRFKGALCHVDAYIEPDTRGSR